MKAKQQTKTFGNSCLPTQRTVFVFRGLTTLCIYVTQTLLMLSSASEVIVHPGFVPSRHDPTHVQEEDGTNVSYVEENDRKKSEVATVFTRSRRYVSRNNKPAAYGSTTSFTEEITMTLCACRRRKLESRLLYKIRLYLTCKRVSTYIG